MTSGDWSGRRTCTLLSCSPNAMSKDGYSIHSCFAFSVIWPVRDFIPYVLVNFIVRLCYISGFKSLNRLTSTYSMFISSFSILRSFVTPHLRYWTNNELIWMLPRSFVPQVKCEEYWPAETKHFNNLTVMNISEIPLEDWTLRDFEVKNVSLY